MAVLRHFTRYIDRESEMSLPAMDARQAKSPQKAYFQGIFFRANLRPDVTIKGQPLVESPLECRIDVTFYALRFIPDIRYAIFDTVKVDHPHCQSWAKLITVPHKQGIPVVTPSSPFSSNYIGNISIYKQDSQHRVNP